jgi:hypothetical protein
MYARQMLETHPRKPVADADVLVACIEACHACAQSCTACADACLGEQEIGMLIRCIRLNQDCEDICAITGAMLSRQTEPDWHLMRRQLEACAMSCRICGDECGRHGDRHAHCRICAEACRACEEACNRMIEAVPA